MQICYIITAIHSFKHERFAVVDPFEAIVFDDAQRAILDQPSGLTNVLLISDIQKGKCRLLDFTDTTIEQAINKILTFYKHKTYRRLIGDHIFFEGFIETEDGYNLINLN